MDKAIFAGGCFWCLDAVFRRVKGVEEVKTGYCGGVVENPSYEEVCSGNTGHAEAVEITFNPKIISYEELLDIFFTIHDPTQLNRQGADIGTQYRSAIFPLTKEQEATAHKKIEELKKKIPIVTTIEKCDTFWEAEAYHQNYYDNNPYQGYCQVVIAPKIEKFFKKFGDKVK